METKLEQLFSRVEDKLDLLVDLVSKSKDLQYEKGILIRKTDRYP